MPNGTVLVSTTRNPWGLGISVVAGKRSENIATFGKGAAAARTPAFSSTEFIWFSAHTSVNSVRTKSFLNGDH